MGITTCELLLMDLYGHHNDEGGRAGAPRGPWREAPRPGGASGRAARKSAPPGWDSGSPPTSAPVQAVQGSRGDVGKGHGVREDVRQDVALNLNGRAGKHAQASVAGGS